MLTISNKNYQLSTLTCAWIFLFLAMTLPDWIRELVSEPLKTSFLWCSWWFSWAVTSLLLICKLSEPVLTRELREFREFETSMLLCWSAVGDHNFVGIGSSKSMHNLTEYLSLTLYSSALCFSTAFISSLMNCMSVWTWNMPTCFYKDLFTLR